MHCWLLKTIAAYVKCAAVQVVAENIADYDLEDLQKLPLDLAQRVVNCLLQRDALVRHLIRHCARLEIRDVVEGQKRTDLSLHLHAHLS